MKAPSIRTDEISIRKHKAEVSYSNSFQFRSRCSTCGKGPVSNVYRSAMYYAWLSHTEYQKQGMNKPLTADRRPLIDRLSSVRRSHYQVHSMKASHFSKKADRYDHRECWPRIVFCPCRASHWTFNNVTEKNSTRMKGLSKKG